MIKRNTLFLLTRVFRVKVLLKALSSPVLFLDGSLVSRGARLLRASEFSLVFPRALLQICGPVRWAFYSSAVPINPKSILVIYYGGFFLTPREIQALSYLIFLPLAGLLKMFKLFFFSIFFFSFIRKNNANFEATYKNPS